MTGRSGRPGTAVLRGAGSLTAGRSPCRPPPSRKLPPKTPLSVWQGNRTDRQSRLQLGGHLLTCQTYSRELSPFQPKRAGKDLSSALLTSSHAQGGSQCVSHGFFSKLSGTLKDQRIFKSKVISEFVMSRNIFFPKREPSVSST